MIAKYKKIMIIFMMQVMSVVINVQACLTTFINDKNVRMFVYNKNDKTIIPICKNEKRRFGNQHKHAFFVVYMQQPKMRFFTRVYTCKQNECGSSGNIQLKLSDIENGTGSTELFTITRHKPYSSMVQELPMVQKKECSVCSDE